MANIRPLSKVLQQKATDELNEDVSRIPDDIQAIREWLQKQNYITARTDDKTILTFLRDCKFNLERTKEKLDTFYTMRTMLPEYLKNRDPFRPEIQQALKLGLCLPLINQKDPTAPRVIIANFAGFDPAKIKREDFFKIIFFIMDILINEDDQANVCGMHILCQLDGLKMAHILPPSMLVKLVRYTEDAHPCQTKSLNMLNMPAIFDTSYDLIKSSFNEKLRKSVSHKMDNYEELHKIIPKEELPKEYGGNGPTLQELTDFWKKKVESYAEWFKDDDKYGTNEKLRPGEPKTSQTTFKIIVDPDFAGMDERM